MSNEEILDGGDRMQIDGRDSELQRSSKVPQGFNVDYLKVYYGILIWWPLFGCEFVVIFFALFVCLLLCMVLVCRLKILLFNSIDFVPFYVRILFTIISVIWSTNKRGDTVLDN